MVVLLLLILTLTATQPPETSNTNANPPDTADPTMLKGNADSFPTPAAVEETLVTVVDKDATVVIFSVTKDVTVDDTDDFSAVTLVATDTDTVTLVTVVSVDTDEMAVTTVVPATVVGSSQGGMTQTPHTLLISRKHRGTFFRSRFIFSNEFI